jgi:hypothetical protein
MTRIPDVRVQTVLISKFSEGKGLVRLIGASDVVAPVDVSLEDLVYEEVDVHYKCGWIPWNEREAHEQSCPLKTHPCRLGCGQRFTDSASKVPLLCNCPT